MNIPDIAYSFLGLAIGFGLYYLAMRPARQREALRKRQQKP